jgi:hypothetical protein
LRQVVSKILAPLLGVPVLLPAILVLVISIKRENIRHDIKERLEEGMLHTIRVKNSECRWVKAGKEMLVNGRMFDVKKQVADKDEIIFSGLYDDEETALNAIAANLWNQHSEKDHTVLSHILQFLQGFFFDNYDNSIAKAQNPGLQHWPAPPGNLTVVHTSITTPPPRS